MIVDITDKNIPLPDRLRHLFEEVRCAPIDYQPLLDELSAQPEPVGAVITDTIEIKTGDAAIVFRADGSQEVLMQEMPEDQIIPDSHLHAMQAAYLFQTPAALALVNVHIESMRE